MTSMSGRRNRNLLVRLTSATAFLLTDGQGDAADVTGPSCLESSPLLLGLVDVLAAVGDMVPFVGVSENRGPQYSTLNSRIRIIRTPVPPIFGNSLVFQKL